MLKKLNLNLNLFDNFQSGDIWMLSKEKNCKLWIYYGWLVGCVDQGMYSMNQGKYSMSQGKYSMSQGKYSMSQSKYSMSQGKYSMNWG